jgi:hypothetical protein
MSRHGSQYTTSYQSTNRPSLYDRPGRSILPNTTGSATSLIKSYNSRNTNASTPTNSRTRPLSRVSYASPDRPVRTNITSIQRRLPSQDRSVRFY